MTEPRDDLDKSIAEWIGRRTPPGEPQFDVDAAWRRLERDRRPTRHAQTPTVRALPTRRVWQIAAAILAVASLASAWGIREARGRAVVEIASPMGRRTAVTLPDGSHATLNGGSVLRYPRRFGAGSARAVTLVGEAFFDVRHDASRPFRVDVGGVRIEDIGTQFVARHYASDSQVEVAVREGAVRVLAVSSNNTVELHAGQAASVDSTGHITAANPSTERILAWTSGALMFDHTPLPVALREFERWYDVRVAIGDSTLVPKRISARFQRESADAALEALAIAVGARVEHRDSVYVLTTERVP